jgi:tetratricopeptide (TPR) repeat protein
MRILVCLAAVSLAALADEDRTEEIRRLLGSGDASYMRAAYDAARQSFERAWEMAQSTAPDDAIRYDVLKRLTAVHTAAGEYTAAEGYLQQALTWRERQFGAAEPKAIDDLLETATLWRKMKEYNRALAIIERAWMLHVQSLGIDSIPAADDMSRKAQIYLDQKDAAKAAGALKQALEIRTKRNGGDSPTLLADLDRLGEVEVSLREYDKAEEIYRHALVIRERLYGKEHADLIATLDGLAYACFGQQKYDDAEPLYYRLLSVWTASAGKDHPMIATVYDKLAGLYADQKKWDQAKEAAGRGSLIRVRFLAMGYAQQAALRLLEGAPDDAKDLYRRALAVMEPSDPALDELRKQIEGNLKLLQPPPKPVTRKASPARKK